MRMKLKKRLYRLSLKRRRRMIKKKRPKRRKLKK
jgi:hypothetical protein